MTFFLLHGFGNSPEMFGPLQSSLTKRFPGCQFLAPDLYQEKFFDPSQNLNFFVASLKRYLAEQAQDPVWAIGYSMGGRLALHGLMMMPEKFKGGVLLSSSPGISGDEERKKRLAQDQMWAERFKSWSWPDLQKEWAELPVFQGSQRKLLREDISQEKLAQSLINWSVSRHLFAKEDLKELKLPTLWISGERDAAYQAQHRAIPEMSPLAQVRVCQSAGHRLLEDALPCTVDNIERFIQENS